MCPSLYKNLYGDTHRNIMGAMERHLCQNWEDFLEEMLP